MVDEGPKKDSSAADSELDADVFRNNSLPEVNEKLGNTENIKEAVMEFRVSKAWIEENNVDIFTVILKRFYGGSWTSFTTKMNAGDEEYYFFGAEVRTSPDMQLWEKK